MKFDSKKIIVLGSSGVLGTGLSAKLKDKNVIETSRSEINSWLGVNGLNNLNRYFSSLATQSVVINAIGITDPKTSFEDLQLINSTLPKNMAYFAEMYGMTLVTFGTIMENFPRLSEKNLYIKTKRNFFDSVQNFPPDLKHMHLQLHTVYGAKRSHPHMLIEQIFRAIYKNSELKMSTGNQIREYHHIDDEINAIIKIMASDRLGVIQVNAGNAIPIKVLAEGIFKAFEMQHLLKHDRELDIDDVYDESYKKEILLHEVSFREPVTGVTDYIRGKIMCR